MGYALDVANIGSNTGDASGTSPDITMTTGAGSSAGARTFVMVAVDAAGAAVTIDSLSGAGATWVRAGGGRDGSNQNAGALFYTDDAVASGQTLTAAVTGNFWEWAIVASSYTSSAGKWLRCIDESVTFGTGTSWASPTVAWPANAFVLAGVAIWGTTGGSTPSNTATSPSVEDNEAGYHATGDFERAVIERRAESSAGSGTVAGTLASSGNTTIVTVAFTEDVFPEAGTPAATNVSTAATTHTVNIPTPAAAGDLLVVAGRVPAGSTFTWPSGWSVLKDSGQAGNSSDRLGLAYKYLQTGDAEIGASTISVVVHATTARLGCWLAWKVKGAEVPGTQAPQVSTDATGASANPDPGSVTPAGGTTKNYLALAIATSEGEQTTPYGTRPADYALYLGGANSGTGGAVATNATMTGVARMIRTGSAVDPGTFTMSASDDWLAWTVLIHPTSSESHSGSSSVRGGGAVAGTGRKDAAATSTARGGGAIAGTGRKAASGASAVSGGGAVTSAGQRDSFDKTGTSSVSGGGSVASSARKGASSSSAVAGGGLVQGAARSGRSSSSTVAGGGAIAGTGRKAASSTSSVRGGGGITSTGSSAEAHTGASSVSGGGSVTSSAIAGKAGSSSVRGGGALASSSSRGASSSSTVSGGGRLFANAVAGRRAASSVTGGGALFATATSSRSSTSFVRGGGFVTSTGGSVPPASPAVTTRTRAGPAASRTKTSIASGRTEAGSSTGMTGTMLEEG